MNPKILRRIESAEQESAYRILNQYNCMLELLQKFTKLSEMESETKYGKYTDNELLEIANQQVFDEEVEEIAQAEGVPPELVRLEFEAYGLGYLVEWHLRQQRNGITGSSRIGGV